MAQWRTLIVAVSLMTADGVARAQGHSPAEAPGRMTPAAGLKVELVASEPLVRQPVAIDFDDRGRLWVIQYLQYPNPAGLERVQVDRFSRTKYDRVPDPPPYGPVGADRLTILEDRDGDGRMDASHDFVSGLNLASGFAFGHGGVFVLNVPYLLFYPDRDRNDVPDSDPEVLLTGFGMEDAHSVANSLTWGPDGWLYGCQGSTVTANIRGSEFQQGVWRYHPRTRQFELFSEGGGNSWGLDFDRDGQLLYSTNVGGSVMLHARPGASLWKQFGKHGALHHPYAFGYFEHVPHTNFHGGHVTVGGLLYRGDNLPAEYRGKYLGGDLLGHQVLWHDVTPDGSTFRSSYGGTLLAANDTWFATSDLALGPDGAIYVADWHDQRTAHPDPDAEWDRTNGRILRISGTQSVRKPVLDPNTLSSADLVQLLDSSNDWLVRRARRILSERQDPAVWGTLRERLTQPAQAVTIEKNPQAEVLWALAVSGGFDDATALTCLSHAAPAVRAWAVRLLGDRGRVSAPLAQRLRELAGEESVPAVRAELAATARRLPAAEGLPIALVLVGRDLERNDQHIPLLLWWAIEQHALTAPQPLVDFFTSPAGRESATAKTFLAPRLLRRYAAQATPDALAAVQKLIPVLGEESALSELQQGLQLASQPATAESLRPVIEPLWRSETSSPRLIALALQAQLPGARERWSSLLADPAIPAKSKTDLLALAPASGGDRDARTLLALLEPASPDPVRLAAIQALSRISDESIPREILRQYPVWSSSAKAQARELLLSRASWAALLLNEVDAGRLPATEIPVADLTRVALHRDKQLDQLVRKHWGIVTSGTPEERLAEVRRFNNDLRASAGVPANGSLIYKKLCATCHPRAGEGTRVGPDLAHANRQDRQFLLTSLVDPSAQIRGEYVQHVLQTTDGRVYTGLLVEQNAAAVALRTAKQELITIPRADIEALETSTVSLMPENLLKPLAPQELRDLFSYLESPGTLAP
ncbi:PVC-type heme-binding CxxCH protein [Planctellipticum variicoloris]|uniref:PVC-type heme-binding CxxCH protein n=1 Tax=Planctellipticum variicoloris TaxID=3064265 RepID=UPI00301336BA|nr:c-type cytochrome [Planctomycetaceae bacterium SH412]